MTEYMIHEGASIIRHRFSVRMMQGRQFVYVACLIVLTTVQLAHTGCNSTPSANDAQLNRAKAQMACNGLVRSYCNKIGTCSIGGGNTAARCESEMRNQLDCSSFRSVDELAMLQCRGDIQSVKCNLITPEQLPVSCQHALRTE